MKDLNKILEKNGMTLERYKEIVLRNIDDMTNLPPEYIIGEAKLKGLRLELEEIFRMEVDISIIKQGGTFDNPPFIPFE